MPSRVPVRRANKRRDFHTAQVGSAPSPLARLARITDWIRAEAKRLSPDQIDDLNEPLFKIASDLNERSQG